MSTFLRKASMYDDAIAGLEPTFHNWLASHNFPQFALSEIEAETVTVTVERGKGLPYGVTEDNAIDSTGVGLSCARGEPWAPVFASVQIINPLTADDVADWLQIIENATEGRTRARMDAFRKSRV